MPRQKLSEYRAKLIIYNALDLPYTGWTIDLKKPLSKQLDPITATKLVLKVDEGVKGRYKKGLVLLDLSPKNLAPAAKKLGQKGYRHLLAEPMVTHQPGDERYLSISAERHGLVINFASVGGVDIEAQPEKIKRQVITKDSQISKLAEQLGWTVKDLTHLLKVFKDNYLVFLELNPYISKKRLQFLDAAAEVDDAGAYFTDQWSSQDFRQRSESLSVEEASVRELDQNSPASLKLNILNPDGSVFLLLSGGGASVVVADEVYNQGYGQSLANYGEYSGNPTTEETYLYTRQLLNLLIRSKAKQKVLFIGGAVANFTDISKTFDGIIEAIDQAAEQLRAMNVKVFVRRGGPNQEAGLLKMKQALDKYGLLGAVHGPSTPLTTAVNQALEAISRG